MKRFRTPRFAVVALALATSALVLVAAVDIGDVLPFTEYSELFGKAYGDEESRREHELVYEANVELIRDVNSKLAEPVLGIGPFADMSQAQFKQERHMRHAWSVSLDDTVSEEGEGLPSLPASFDWRDKGAVTGIKDQGSCGTCWAFSTTGNLEGQNYLKHGELVSLSEEQLVDCDYNDCGVFGGWPSNAYKYIKEAGGLQAEATFPYCSGSGHCYPCMADKNETFCGPPPEYCDRNCTADRSKFVVSLSSWFNVSQSESQIAEQLVSVGPLSVLLDADLLQFYHSGVWDPPDWMCDPTSLDHAVLLIGYGTHKTILGEEEPYWLVKNSWGEKWGEKGTFRIRRGKGKCGINRAVSSGVVA